MLVVIGALASHQPSSNGPVGFVGQSAAAGTQGASFPTTTQVPLRSAHPTATSLPGVIPTQGADPTGAPDPTPTPAPTPVNSVIDTAWNVGSSKSSESGRIGTYSWTDVEFGDELARVAWTAKAPAGKTCTLQWTTGLEYGDPVSKTIKVSAGKSSSGSKEFETDYSSATLDISSTCASWTLTLTSYEMPSYWNPWGYNFRSGRLIYDPPIDFCYYFDCIASFWDSTNGYVEQCADKMFSHSGGRSGSCSWHGGNYRPLYRH